MPPAIAYNTLDLNTRLTARKQIISLIGEVGFEATYRFKPNLMGRAAYDFMWVNGLALGPEQFQFNQRPHGRHQHQRLALFSRPELGIGMVLVNSLAKKNLHVGLSKSPWAATVGLKFHRYCGKLLLPANS